MRWGTSAINGRLAGGDIAIVSSLVNTLPYYIIGKSAIKSPEDLQREVRCRTHPRHIGRLCHAPCPEKVLVFLIRTFRPSP